MPPRLVSLFASLLLALTLVALTLTTTTHAVCGGLSPWEIVAGSCSKFVHCVDGTGPGARSPVARCSQLLLNGRSNDCGTGPGAAAAAAAPLSVKKNKKRVRRLCEEHVRYESVANALEVVAVYSGRKTRRSLGGTGSTAAGSSTTHTTETPASAVEMVARMLGAFQSELSADCASTLLIAQLRWSAQSASRLLDSIVAYDQAVMEHGVRGSRQLSSQQLSLPSTTSLGSSQQEQDTRDGVLIGNDTDDNNGVVDMADVEHRDTADSAITGSPVQLPTSTIFQSMARCHTARSRMAVDTLTAVVKLIVEGSIGNVRNTAGVDDTDDALLRPHEVSCLLKLERAPAADAFIEVYRASVAASTTSSDATSTSSSSFSSPSSSHHLSSPTLHRLLRIRRRTTVDCLRTLVDYGLSPASDPRYIILCADTVQGAAQLQGMRDYLHLGRR